MGQKLVPRGGRPADTFDGETNARTPSSNDRRILYTRNRGQSRILCGLDTNINPNQRPGSSEGIKHFNRRLDDAEKSSQCSADRGTERRERRGYDGERKKKKNEEEEEEEEEEEVAARRYGDSEIYKTKEETNKDAVLGS